MSLFLSLCHVTGSQTLFSEDLSPFWMVGFYLSDMLRAARHCFQRIYLHSGWWGSISLPCYGQPDTVFRGFISILEGGVLSLCHVMGSQTLFSEDLSPCWMVDAVMQGVYHGRRQSPHNYAAPDTILLVSVCGGTAHARS